MVFRNVWQSVTKIGAKRSSRMLDTHNFGWSAQVLTSVDNVARDRADREHPGNGDYRRNFAKSRRNFLQPRPSNRNHALRPSGWP